jgi:hypothetical protein
MPPPLPSQQGSRTGLITTLVIFIVLFLIAAVFAIAEGSKRSHAENDLDALKKKYASAISENALSTPEFAGLADKSRTTGRTAFDLLLAQRDELAKAIVGQPAPAEDVQRMAQGSVQSAVANMPKSNGQPVVSIANSQPLTAVISQLATAVSEQWRARDDAQKQFAAAQQQATQAAQTFQQTIAQKDADLAAKDQEVAKIKAEVDTLRQQYAQKGDATAAEMSNQIKSLSDQIAAFQTTVAQKDAELAKAKARADSGERVLKGYRLDAKENITRHPDGKISRVDGNGQAGAYCYIDLGVGDHLPVGMTFEVYDAVSGIPPLGDGLSTPDEPTRGGGSGGATGASAQLGPSGIPITSRAGSGRTAYEQELPRGKGSIEVVSVGPGHTSQCRIIKAEPGQTIHTGDIIGNLVYDRHLKPKFFVYGEFDMNMDGIANSQDAGVVRQKVQSWGGELVDQINVDTDFVVMGKEPKVPSGDPNNPAEAKAMEDAKAKYDAYQDIRKQAVEYGVPIMNLDRFLYLTGYYDQRKR